MPAITTATTHTPSFPRKRTVRTRDIARHFSWWRAQAPGLIAQIDAELADAHAAKEPLAVLIKPRAVSFPTQSDLFGDLTRPTPGEVHYGLPLADDVTLADLRGALQGDALTHLAKAHLWLQEIDALVLRGPGGIENPAIHLMMAQLTAATTAFSDAVQHGSSAAAA